MNSSHVGRSFVISGVLFAAVLGGCLDAEGTGEVGQETAGSAAVGVVVATGNLGIAKIEVTAGGHTSEVKGPTTLVQQEITVQPGGHTGWHTHGGIAFVSIAQGALTVFDGSAPCTGKEFPTGGAFFDPGGGHVHIARNLGSTVAIVRVQYIVPTGQPIRIDVPAPAGADACP